MAVLLALGQELVQRLQRLIPNRNSLPDRRSPPEILEVGRLQTRLLPRALHPALDTTPVHGSTGGGAQFQPGRTHVEP